MKMDNLRSTTNSIKNNNKNNNNIIIIIKIPLYFINL